MKTIHSISCFVFEMIPCFPDKVTLVVIYSMLFCFIELVDLLMNFISICLEKSHCFCSYVFFTLLCMEMNFRSSVKFLNLMKLTGSSNIDGILGLCNFSDCVSQLS